MTRLRFTHLAVGALLAAVVVLMTAGSALAAQAYGVAISKSCVSPVAVGAGYTCTAGLDNNNSSSHDTVTVSLLVDHVLSSTGDHAVTIPINASTPGLSLFAITATGATCSTTLCTLPYGTGLSVTFSHYTAVAGDFPNIA